MSARGVATTAVVVGLALGSRRKASRGGFPGAGATGGAGSGNRGNAGRGDRHMKAARMMAIAGLVALLMAWGVPTQAVTTTTVNFDAVNLVDGGTVGGIVRDAYLAQYGITLSDIAPGLDVRICDQDYYGGPTWPGDFVRASSLRNIMTQWGPQGPMSFRMNFASPVEEFGFTRAGAGSGTGTGLTGPEWWVSAYSSSGVLLASAHEYPWSTYSGIPPATFTLDGHGQDIAYVVVASDNYHWAAFESVLFDDLVLTEPDKPIPEPVTMATVGLGIAGLGGYIRRRMAK